MMAIKRQLLLLTLGLEGAAFLTSQSVFGAAIDRELAEVTIPKLERFYETHRYTVTQVVHWYAARIEKYDGIYQAIEQRDFESAFATAAREDAEAARVANLARPPLWGVPIVIKANTSIQGRVTTDGWAGFVIPGHELIASKDATVVAKLRAAGAIIIGRTNMPDLAFSDTTRSTSFGRTGNAYDVRYSPGGSSGGAVTAVSANFAVVGTGTDTSNSIRMPSSTSAVVGVLPTRGLVSIAGIAPFDWLRDNTGPIARNLTDAAIVLGVMAGEDPGDFRTRGSATSAQPGPYTRYLSKDALRGKRFGVPAFIVMEHTAVPGEPAGEDWLHPQTRAMFMKAVEELRAAGATVLFDDSILPETFQQAVGKVVTRPYRLEGTEAFLKEYGPAEYHSSADYEKIVGSPLPYVITGLQRATDNVSALPFPPVPQMVLETDSNAESNFFGPQREALALYNDTLERFHLDGFVYPAAQIPPPDETMPQDGQLSSGPHSATGWVNRIGVPTVVVPAGFYASGLPFGLEFSARRWKDGDLLAWAYSYEQSTKHRRPPILVEKGLLARKVGKPMVQ
jgi:Asp-tRNA(Asn)/Glu-tRNA(Gln) amidotransferase A subunit family amidase